MITREAIELVVSERRRQDRLKADGRFPYTCADDELSPFEKYAVLSEEVGEVARALLEASDLSNHKNYVELRKELIQVAAVAVAWIESLTSDS
jgi:NTP pyrophosphatase (non-canonical NTP hydrolase)